MITLSFALAVIENNVFVKRIRSLNRDSVERRFWTVALEAVASPRRIINYRGLVRDCTAILLFVTLCRYGHKVPNTLKSTGKSFINR